MTASADSRSSSVPGSAAVEACCAILYGDPAIELVLGDSLHPGGLAATESLLLAADLRPGARLLDLGCGTGASSWLASARLPGVSVTGLDTSEAAIARARARERVRAATTDPAADQPHAPSPPVFVRGSAVELPFEDASFDAVLAECVLSTLDKDRALTEIRRVLAPGGSLLVSDMTVSSAGSLGSDPAHPILAAALCLSGAWPPGELERSLAAHGFAAAGWRDEGSALRAMLTRVAERTDLLRVVARDLGAQLGARLGEIRSGTFEDALSALRWARAAADDGRIGYASITAVRR